MDVSSNGNASHRLQEELDANRLSFPPEPTQTLGVFTPVPGLIVEADQVHAERKCGPECSEAHTYDTGCALSYRPMIKPEEDQQ